MDIELVLPELHARDASAAVFTDPASVLYLSGYFDPGDVGFPYVGLPTAVVVGERKAVLLVPNVRLSDAEVLACCSVLSYDVYDFRKTAVPAESFRDSLEHALQLVDAKTGRLGYELLRAPATVFHLGRELVDVSGALASLRAVKRADEIASIRAAARLADVAHARIRELVAPGVREIELFAEARAAMEIAAGERIQAAGDLVGNERAATLGEGQPGADRLEDGSTVIADIIPVLRGYFVDTCMTYPVGQLSSKLRGLFDIVLHAFQTGSSLVRPGVTGAELDSTVRGLIQKHGYDYAHHTGHGVGTTRWEEPFVLPGSSSVLQEGMILALEPGIYERGVGGVRIEHTMLVTNDGADLLTRHAIEGIFS
jgi:Xaa-Pro dipeptidase